MYIPSRKACEVLGLCANTLRKYANNGKIEYIKNDAGQRLYNVSSFMRNHNSRESTICYCRVSSTKQKDDLARQIIYMQEQFPGAEIIQDIGSGLNYKRKGIKTILERLMCGDKLTIIVAHRDRLCRFGFELFQYLVEQNGGQLLVLDKTIYSPEQELTADLLNILHVFSCRMHGLRSYSDKIKKDKSLSNS
jgi:putative resolvase